MTENTRPHWYSIVWFGSCPPEWRRRPTYGLSLSRLIQLATDVSAPPSVVRIVQCPTMDAAAAAGIDGPNKVVWTR